MADEKEDLYIGQDGYLQRTAESGQLLEVNNNAFSLGLEVLMKTQRGEKANLSSFADLASSAAKAEDDPESVTENVVGSSLGLMQSELEFCNDRMKSLEDLDWDERISNLPVGSGHALTLKVTGAYDNLKAAIQLFDSLCMAILHVSPVDELIKKPFFGDWDAIVNTSQTWDVISQQLEKAKKNLSTITETVYRIDWDGEARDKFDTRMGELANAVELAIVPSQNMKSALELLAEIAEDALDLIISIIDQIVGLLELLMGECTLGPLGWAVATVTAASKAYDIYNLFCDGVDMVNKVSNFISNFHSASENIIKAVSHVNDIKVSFPS